MSHSSPHAGFATLNTLFWHFATEIADRPEDTIVQQNARRALRTTLVTSRTDTDSLAQQLVTSLNNPEITIRLPQIRQDFADVLATVNVGTQTTNEIFMDAAHEYFARRSVNR